MAQPVSQARVLITGASRGIGAAIAREFAGGGARLFCTARGHAGLEELARELQESAGSVTIFPIDLSEEGACDTLAAEAGRHFDRLDLLVNNAGIAQGAPFVETSAEELRSHLRLNLEVPFLLTRALLPLLRAAVGLSRADPAGDAVVVNMASVVGHKGYERQSAYGASKHGLLGFTKAVAKELQPLGIRVHAVSPGGTATEMIEGVRPDLDPSGLIQPEAIARTVRFLYELGDGAAIDEIRLRRTGGTPWA
jgi:3-oxoacyl-[acyl-carrier protein] reductase